MTLDTLYVIKKRSYQLRIKIIALNHPYSRISIFFRGLYCRLSLIFRLFKIELRYANAGSNHERRKNELAKDRLLAIFLVSEVYKRHASRGLFRDAWFTWRRQGKAPFARRFFSSLSSLPLPPAPLSLLKSCELSRIANDKCSCLWRTQEMMW